MLFALSLGQVHFLDAVAGDYLDVYVNYRNTGEKVEDAKVTVYIPDLEVYERSIFDVKKDSTGVRVMLPSIPDDAQAGWYPMWTILSADGQRTWKFDWVYVQ